MPLLELAKGTHRVAVYCTIEDDYTQETPALDFLREMAAKGNYSGSAKGFKKLFERFADGGRQKLTAELFHEVDNNESIWEFIKGDLRIFCFMEGNTVYLTHGAIKKSRKVDPAEVTRATNIKKIIKGE